MTCGGGTMTDNPLDVIIFSCGIMFALWALISLARICFDEAEWRALKRGAFEAQRQAEREVAYWDAEQAQAQSEIRAQEAMAAAREALAILTTPSADAWLTLDQPLRIDLSGTVFATPQPQPERELEHWSDIRPSRSGPFTLEGPLCE